MYQAQHNKYMQTAIQTASPAQLLIMLYDGAIRFSRISIEAIKQGKHEVANENLNKVQNIIQEFIITLDRKSAVAENLLKLYEYFIFRLVEANRLKSIEPIEEVLEHLQELKQTWTEAARSAASSKVGVLNG